MLIISSKKKIKFLIVATLLLAFVFLFSAKIGQAATGAFGEMQISKYLTQIATSPDVNLSGERPEMTSIIGSILYGVLGFLGVLCLLLTIYAGLKWMLAEGNEETISESRKIIFYAIIGLVIIMGAYAMTSFVVTKIWESTIPDMPAVNLNLDRSGINIDGPVDGIGDGCQGNSDCPNCSWGTPSCNFNIRTNVGICECVNNCNSGSCDANCRNKGQDGGSCESDGSCTCY